MGGWILYFALVGSDAFFRWFLRHESLVAVTVVLLQLGVTMLFITRLLPTWIDNSYRHENRADNLGSLRRV